MKPILSESSSGTSFLTLYILLFYLHVHLLVALHNHVCIVIGLLFFLLEQVNCQEYTTPKTLVVQPLLYVSLSDHYFYRLFYV